MVRPFIVLYLVVERTVIIKSVADINNEVVVLVLCLEVFCNIFNRVPVEFLHSFSGWESHRYQTFRNISEIEVFSFKRHETFRTSHELFDHS